MLGPPKDCCLDQLVPISLEAWVPKDNFYRHLDAALDLRFVRDWVGELYADRGRPSIDPVVFFKLQLILFFAGLRSERKLMETVALNLAHRWYLRYGLDEPLPDHSSLTRIRERLGRPIFRRFFEYVVELCQQAGLVWGGELIFDATKVRANADVDSLVPRWYAKAKVHLDDLFISDAATGAIVIPNAAEAADRPTRDVMPVLRGGAAAAVAAPAIDPAAPSRLPFAGTPQEDQELAEENQAVWKLLDQHRLDPERPASCSYQRITDLRVSTTDPDATPMRAGDQLRLGYHDHYVVDGGRARVILAALVTPADVMENQPMLDLLERVRFRWKVRPRRAIGDTTYGTIENIWALEAAGIRAYVPLPDFDQRTPYFGASHFTYDAAGDAYCCPQGHSLSRTRVKYTEAVVVYQAAAATCNTCPLKAQCTTSDAGRQVRRSFHADYVDRVRGYHQTEAYQKAMRKRAVWVEPLFGEAKDWHGLRRFRLRGLWKVNCEGLLVAAGQNLKRWLTKTGWGRRHGPRGSLAVSRRTPAMLMCGDML
jgi:transposase